MTKRPAAPPIERVSIVEETPGYSALTTRRSERVDSREPGFGLDPYTGEITPPWWQRSWCGIRFGWVRRG